MSFLTDENIPRNVIDMLRDMGHEMLDVREQRMDGAPDSEVAGLARDERRVLVTLDMDFSNILHYPPGDYAGVIVLRVPKPTRHRVAVTLKEFLAAVKETDIEQSLIIVEPGSYRIRRDK